MSHYSFDWDPRKDAANRKKHDVSFQEAKTAFTDEFARLIADPDHSEEEDRFILLGTSIHSPRYKHSFSLTGGVPLC